LTGPGQKHLGQKHLAIFGEPIKILDWVEKNRNRLPAQTPAAWQLVSRTTKKRIEK